MSCSLAFRFVFWRLCPCFRKQVAPNDAVFGHSLTPVTERPCWIIQNSVRLGQGDELRVVQLAPYFCADANRRGNLSSEPRDTIARLKSSSVYASKCRPSPHPRKWTGSPESPWGRPRNRENPKALLSTALRALRLSFHRCRSSKVR